MPNLRSTLVSGFKWYVAGQVLQRVFSVAAMAILARRLQPSDFGLFALAFIAIDGLQLFQTLGLNAAIVQRKELTEQTKHTAFVLILITGIAMTVVCYLGAPVAANFFKSEAVEKVVQALAPLFLLACFSRVPTALLSRDLRYRDISVIQSSGAMLNSILSVVYVLFWPSVWSLVLAYLCKQIAVTVAMLYASGYRPRLQFHGKSAKELLGYGRFMMGVALLTYLWMNMDQLVIGRVLGPTQLGYFVLGLTIADLANRYFAAAVADMMFPAFSKLQDLPQQLALGFLKSTRLVTVVSVPFGVLLVCLAEPIVLTLYGDGWKTTIPLVQVLGISSFIVPLSCCAPPLFRACGVPRYDLNLMLAGGALRIGLLIGLTTQWGLRGAVWAGIITLSLLTPLSLRLVRRLIPITYGRLLGQLRVIWLSGLSMLACILLTESLLGLPEFAAIAGSALATACVLVAVGLVGYGASLCLLDRALAVEIKEMLLRSKTA